MFQKSAKQSVSAHNYLPSFEREAGFESQPNREKVSGKAMRKSYTWREAEVNAKGLAVSTSCQSRSVAARPSCVHLEDLALMEIGTNKEVSLGVIQKEDSYLRAAPPVSKSQTLPSIVTPLKAKYLPSGEGTGPPKT